MAEDASASKEPLDVQKVHYLVRLMKRYDLTALDLSDTSVQIRLRRRGPESRPIHATHPSAASDLAPPPPAHSVSPTDYKPETVPTSVSGAPKTIVIESPMVGTYFSSSAPDTPPFV